jgi:transcription termination factor NusB
MQQKIEISKEELESLSELVKGIEEEMQATKEKLTKLEKSLEFLNLVLKNLLQDR